MNIPNENDLTSKEANARVVFASNDNSEDYPKLLKGRFCEIIRLINSLPQDAYGEDDMLLPIYNWDSIMDSYLDWGVPIERGDDMKFFKRRMQTQHIYNSNMPPPQEQVQRMMASCQEKKMKEYTQSEEYRKGQNQFDILLIQMHHMHSQGTKEKIWRLVVCRADTNLENLHDQIIAPAMGWGRGYHGYKITIPTSGVSFGPKHSNYIDMMWSEGYTWDSEKYDLRHVLRKPGDRICYIYDLGDDWRHYIILLGRVDSGTKIGLNYFKKYKHVKDALKRSGVYSRGSGEEWSLKIIKNQLIAGEINCPPEDSNGCEQN